MDRQKLEEAKDRFENMKKMCEVQKATGCTKCGNICDTAIECIDFVLGMTFCKDCSRRESCWVDDDDYCSSGWAKIHKDIDDNTATLRKLLDEKYGRRTDETN